VGHNPVTLSCCWLGRCLLRVALEHSSKLQGTGLGSPSTLGKLGKDTELAHCRVLPRCCCPLPGLCGALVSLGAMGCEGSLGLRGVGHCRVYAWDAVACYGACTWDVWGTAQCAAGSVGHWCCAVRGMQAARTVTPVQPFE